MSMQICLADLQTLSDECKEMQYTRTGWVTAEVCGWASDGISSACGARYWFCSHDCHDRLRGAVRIQMYQLSAVFTAVYTERTHAVVCWSHAHCSDISSFQSVDGWWHCLTDCTNTACQYWVQTLDGRCLHLPADPVAVSNDSVSVEATSPSGVTSSDTRLHQSRSEKTFGWYTYHFELCYKYNAGPVNAEVNWK